MITSMTEIRVRYGETDRMGLAYHAHYLAWFDATRVNLMDELGCPYHDMEANGFHLPVLEAFLQYHRPLTFDDKVRITAVIKDKPSVRIRIDYTLVCRGQVAGEGHTLHAFINGDGQPVRPPKHFRDVMDTLFPPGQS
jgi:acyl-CoA thioester hydrolase